jgi:hypothetical protein
LECRVSQQSLVEVGRSFQAGCSVLDRITLLPESLEPELIQRLEKIRRTHEKDLVAGFGCVYLTHALEKKLPGAATEWKWQYVFPSGQHSIGWQGSGWAGSFNWNLCEAIRE